MGMRRVFVGIIGVGLLTMASAAFACTAQPQVRYSLLPEAASPGATVLVEGSYVRTQGQVEVRWNGVSGALLAVATPAQGEISVPVQVPDVAPGVYSLMLVTDSGVGRTPFEVTGSASNAPAAVSSAQLWPGATDGLVAAEPVSGGPGMIGVGLLAVGLVGLVGGSAVAVTQRRRVLA